MSHIIIHFHKQIIYHAKRMIKRSRLNDDKVEIKRV